MPKTPSAKAVYAFVFAFLSPFSMAASPESDALTRAYEARAQGDWDLARQEAQGVGRDIIEWHSLRAGRGTFEAYRDFLKRNADWPGLPLLAEKGEAVIPTDADPKEVTDYLTAYPPQTGRGALRLISAFEARNMSADAQAQAVLTWNTLPMGAEEETILLSRYGSILTKHHVARAEMLLWRERFEDALRMVPNLPTGWDKLIVAARKLVKDEAGVDDAISAVPAALADHPILAHARFEWRVRRGRNEDATTLLLQHSTAEGLGEPVEWGNRRRMLARQMMRDGKGKIAYSVAARHGLAPEQDHYADLEWLSGYIALRYLDDAGLALDHFNRFRMAVGTPISLGRAGYWEGRALEAMGARDDAAAAYAFGAQFQTAFYGLLSAEKIGLPLDPALTGEMRFADYKQAAFMGSSVLKAALLLEEAGETPLAARFLRHLGESLSPQELGQLGDLALDHDAYLAVLVAKFAADQGIVLNRAYYPLHALAEADLPVEPELAMAIARRESEFYPMAQSHVGARGLMQLMPRTGEAMAEKVGIENYSDSLLFDPIINTRLGSAYLAQLIEEFGDNIPLVAVGYNAGPTRARDWIKRYGDPRTGEVDPVDWIEHLPFRETQNYVMRVAESIPVYRARLHGETGPVHMMDMLSGR
ncbi:lytic transglycosylase domain-containing protein [uncultured Celeribacter sp.]|uniref:lytic transglycosylase domain-containing protein n=1 Tax=uncultured Celeribacter sp. TaxID=1303376 RepID=UPI002AA64570|nr:lytic transglycosylase domain-containing protein [uncultured Celeribacter sp.]